jgi:hypothetical protein
MDIRKELYKKGEEEWAYRIIKNNTVIIHQDFKPFANGFQSMTEEEANKYADDYIKSISETEESNLNSVSKEIKIEKPESILSRVLGIFKKR